MIFNSNESIALFGMTIDQMLIFFFEVSGFFDNRRSDTNQAIRIIGR